MQEESPVLYSIRRRMGPLRPFAGPEVCLNRIDILRSHPGRSRQGPDSRPKTSGSQCRAGGSGRSSTPPAGSELDTESYLRPAGVPESAPQRPVEVEEEGADRGVDEVVCVGKVEHFEDRLEVDAIAKRESPRQA